jgi:hypothetical protein
MSMIDKIKTIRVGLIDDWAKLYKFASVQMLLLIGAMPSIYDGIAAMGWVDQVPTKFAWIIRIMASAGIVVRVLKKRQADGAT